MPPGLCWSGLRDTCLAGQLASITRPHGHGVGIVPPFAVDEPLGPFLSARVATEQMTSSPIQTPEVGQRNVGLLHLPTEGAGGRSRRTWTKCSRARASSSGWGASCSWAWSIPGGSHPCSGVRKGLPGGAAGGRSSSCVSVQFFYGTNAADNVVRTVGSSQRAGSRPAL